MTPEQRAQRKTTRDIVAAIDRLTGAIERLVAAGQPPPPQTEVECIRCAGRGSWGPNSPCHVCNGAGTVPAE